MTETLYIYRWNRMGRKGQICRVLIRGPMNSCLVQFTDGYRAITSRNGVLGNGEKRGRREERLGD